MDIKTIIFEHTGGKITGASPHETAAFTAGWLESLAQRVRREALLEAAMVCERRCMGDNNREDAEARRCAEAIRALIEAPKS